MLVIGNYKELKSDCGVSGKPIQRGGFWCVPLGWEEELEKAGIEFELKEVTYTIDFE